MANLYRAGDRVRVTSGGYDDVEDGTEGMVTGVSDSGDLYDVHVDALSETWAFWETEIICKVGEEKEDSNMDGLAALREALAEKVTDTFEDGTVFRWVSGDKYTYAAVKAAGRYWLTGGAAFYGTGVKSYEEMLDIFSRPDVSNIEVATAWEAV